VFSIQVARVPPRPRGGPRKITFPDGNSPEKVAAVQDGEREIRLVAGPAPSRTARNAAVFVPHRPFLMAPPGIHLHCLGPLQYFPSCSPSGGNLTFGRGDSNRPPPVR
jgi:hypothetical protein